MKYEMKNGMKYSFLHALGALGVFQKTNQTDLKIPLTGKFFDLFIFMVKKV